MPRLALLAPLLAVAACNTGFPPQYLVSDLRILAVRASVAGGGDVDWADADTGDVLTLEALVANPENLSPLKVEWKACLPQVGSAVPPCLDPKYIQDPALLDASPDVYALGEGLRLDVPVPDSFAPAIQAAVDRARAQPAYACTLYADFPVLVIASAGTERRAALKRVRLSPYREVAGTPLALAYPRNANPAVEELRQPSDPGSCLGGRELTGACATADDCGSAACLADLSQPGFGTCALSLDPGPSALCARPTPSSSQTYARCDPDGTLHPIAEELTLQWYATAGKLEDSDKNDARSPSGNVTGWWTTFTPPASGSYTLWLVIRDDRGGESWVERRSP